MRGMNRFEEYKGWSIYIRRRRDRGGVFFVGEASKRSGTADPLDYKYLSTTRYYSGVFNEPKAQASAAVHKLIDEQET
jgi:hypothetical protein